ncbi:MAG: type VI secretion system tip protein VgrG, partial [Nitrospirota bacterium]|nr:type VI secretion system tip protein VgrG [Nitrospirota bacterium]
MASLDDKLGTQKRFGFTSKSLPPGTFSVAELSGTEAISRPYEFELTLVSENPDLPLETVLDQPATLTIHPRTGAAQSVLYHGLVKQLEQAHQIGSYTFYRVLLAPRVWDLSLDRISEVYLDRTIPQILDLKLKENGLTSQDYELKLASTYKPWPYVCQYQETDLAFIARLMERDGIYFYFEQGTEREKLIVIDAKAMQPASVRKVSYRPAAQLETGISEESIQAWVCRQKPVPRKVVLQDYNYRTASLALSAEADVVSSGKGEMRLYGEAFETQQEGKALAMIRAQELACRKKTFQGDGTATGLRAGFFMEVQGHYRTDFNGRYLVTEVRHEGAQAGTLLAGLEGKAGEGAREDFYRNECAAVPADVQFRPERLTPKPVIHGTMTAFVDAEGSGQYAELDDQGRYKVQLPFDKTDKGAAKASAWIRMATPYAGKDHGMHLPLHKGAEVLLSFQDGDPNWPVITAAVPNSDNPNLVTRNNQTQSAIRTAGSNLLTFEDKEGSERIYLKTPKAQTHIRMGAAKSETVSGDPPGTCTDGEETIDGLCFETEAHSYTEVGGNSIEIIHGNSTETVYGDMSETVGGNFRETLNGTSFSLIKG